VTSRVSGFRPTSRSGSSGSCSHSWSRRIIDFSNESPRYNELW
jgi:hypothetical protein